MKSCKEEASAKQQLQMVSFTGFNSENSYWPSGYLWF